MREFKRPGGTLTRLSGPAKMLYVGFVVLTLCGFVTALWLYYDSLGLSAASAEAYYLGNADDPDAEEMILEKSPRQLMEVVHFHLFTMPVVLLVFGHLFLLARGGAWKTWVVVAATVVTLLHAVGPLVVRWGGSGTGWFMGVTGVALVVLYLVMALWPLPELFGARPEG